MFNALGVLRALVKVGQFSRILTPAKASNPLKMAVTVNTLAQDVELTEPVHIVNSVIRLARPFILIKFERFRFFKIARVS